MIQDARKMIPAIPKCASAPCTKGPGCSLRGSTNATVRGIEMLIPMMSLAIPRPTKMNPILPNVLHVAAAEYFAARHVGEHAAQ